jgi:hypothetical protein
VTGRSSRKAAGAGPASTLRTASEISAVSVTPSIPGPESLAGLAGWTREPTPEDTRHQRLGCANTSAVSAAAQFLARGIADLPSSLVVCNNAVGVRKSRALGGLGPRARGTRDDIGAEAQRRRTRRTSRHCGRTAAPQRRA